MVPVQMHILQQLPVVQRVRAVIGEGNLDLFSYQHIAIQTSHFGKVHIFCHKQSTIYRPDPPVREGHLGPASTSRSQDGRAGR